MLKTPTHHDLDDCLFSVELETRRRLLNHAEPVSSPCVSCQVWRIMLNEAYADHAKEVEHFCKLIDRDDRGRRIWRAVAIAALLVLGAVVGTRWM